MVPGSSPPPDRSFRLEREEKVGDGLVRVLRGRAEKAIEAVREPADADPAAAIHSARKDIKKIRAVLRLLRGELGERTYRIENKRYRKAGRALSSSRDAEVKVATLLALEDHFGREMPSASAWGWRRQLQREREQGSGRGDAEAVDAAVGALSAGLEATAEWQLSGSWRLFGPGLQLSYARGRKAMAQIAEDSDPELVHLWRKRSKDLWYGLRLVSRAWPELLSPTVDGLHELSDLLGVHHDLTVLAEDLTRREGVGSRAKMAALIDRRREALLAEALTLGALLYAEKPKAFGRRVHAYWSVWR